MGQKSVVAGNSHQMLGRWWASDVGTLPVSETSSLLSHKAHYLEIFSIHLKVIITVGLSCERNLRILDGTAPK